MRLVIVQHHRLETPGFCLTWAASHGLEVLLVDAQRGSFPRLRDSDIVLLLGGPVNVADADAIAWLHAELQWLKALVASGTSVFAICLGAQLLAHVLGAAITPLAQAELGWVSVDFTPELAQELNDDASQIRAVLQWHAQGFALPEGALALASSALTAQQGFLLERRAQRLLAVQFHPEWDASILRTLIAELASDGEKSLLNAALSEASAFAAQQDLTHRLLNYWALRPLPIRCKH
jgi:GMP synthase-like glutamine amidotransferase